MTDNDFINRVYEHVGTLWGNSHVRIAARADADRTSASRARSGPSRRVGRGDL